MFSEWHLLTYVISNSIQLFSFIYSNEYFSNGFKRMFQQKSCHCSIISITLIYSMNIWINLDELMLAKKPCPHSIQFYSVFNVMHHICSLRKLCLICQNIRIVCLPVSGLCLCSFSLSLSLNIKITIFKFNMRMISDVSHVVYCMSYTEYSLDFECVSVVPWETQCHGAVFNVWV